MNFNKENHVKNVTKMEHAKIIAEIERLGPWWRHNIDLGKGIHTKVKVGHTERSDRPREKWEGFKDHLPSDLKGKRVLDIGCSEGFFSIAAKRRGADEVLGVDFDERCIARADFAKEVLQLDIQYRVGSVYDVVPKIGKFDIVFFLGVLYHLDHPLLALQKIAPICNDLLFLDTHALVDDPSDGGIEIMRFFKDGFGGDKTNRWVPNRPCLKSMLADVGFRDIQDLSYSKSRALYLARKQAVK
jgi:tRNA (mo5U34)-methyltransferase